MRLERKNSYVNRFIDFLILIVMTVYSFLIIHLINSNTLSLSTLKQSRVLEDFSIIFISIILEAIPFVIIGAFVSSLIQIFISEQTISKVLPKNRFIALLSAGVMGFVFPVCECAIVPIMRRLIKKGVPVDVAVTFMAAVPIVNPVVLLSTYYAFSGSITMVVLRGGLGFIAAVIIGLIIGAIQKKNPLKKNPQEIQCACGCHGHHSYSNIKHIHIQHSEKRKTYKNIHIQNYSHGHKHNHVKNSNKKNVLFEILEHTSLELYDVGKFLIFGALLSSIMQVVVNREALISIGNGNFSSIFIMMIMAFTLSLCSEADAFVASTFTGQFTIGALLAFLVLGPMIDIKNAMMLNSVFKKGFILKLVTVIFLICFLITTLLNIVWI